MMVMMMMVVTMEKNRLGFVFVFPTPVVVSLAMTPRFEDKSCGWRDSARSRVRQEAAGVGAELTAGLAGHSEARDGEARAAARV